ncbi:hypothetical protein WJX79_003148 [Trebouxia sp. C0005]
MPALTGHQEPVIPPNVVDFANKRIKARKSASPRPSWDVPTAFRDDVAARRTTAARARETRVRAELAQRQELIVTGPRRVTTPKRYQEAAEDHDDMSGVKSHGRARSRAAPRAPSATRRTHTSNSERPRAVQPQQAASLSGPVPQSPKHKMPLRPGGPCHACACTKSPVWRRGKPSGLYAGEYFCNACGTHEKRHGLDMDMYDLGKKVDDADAGTLDKQAVEGVVRRRVKVNSRARGRAAASRAGEDLAGPVASMRGRTTGHGRAVAVTLEDREARMGLRQGPQAHKNPDLGRGTVAARGEATNPLQA